jgi:hypothetical protein
MSVLRAALITLCAWGVALGATWVVVVTLGAGGR